MVVFQFLLIGFFGSAFLHFLQLSHDDEAVLEGCAGLGGKAERAVFAFLDEIAHLHQLAGQVHPLLLVQLPADAVSGEPVMAQLQEAFALRAEQHLGDVRGAEPFPGALDAGEELLGRDGDIGQLRGFGVAVVAVLAVRYRVGLAEVIQQRLAAAIALILGKAHDGIQMLLGHQALGAFLLVDKIF